MTFDDSYGSAFLVAQRNHGGGYYLQWRARLNFPGEAMLDQVPNAIRRVTMLNLGVPICAKCAAALDLPMAMRDEVLENCKSRDCRKLAWQRCASILKQWTDEMWRDLNAPPPVPAPAAEPAAGSTVNDLFEAWDELDETEEPRWKRALNASAGTEARRQVTSFMRVLAFAFDAWVIKDAGDGRRGVMVGEKQADMARLGPMLLSEALTEDAAELYFERSCKAAGVPASWSDSNAERPQYVTINRTMQQARCLFTKKALRFVYKGRVTMPGGLMEWKNFPLLPAPKKLIDPILGDDFARMVAARDALKLAQPKLYLCNKVLTQTGLRSGSVEAMRGDWAVLDNGTWKLHAKEVKSGTIQYAVAITEDLAREIQAHGDGYCFGESDAEREEIVKRRHNAWLKGIVAGPRRGTQGNHRLRQTLASAVRAIKGIDEARKLLGHADKEVTAASYAAVGVQVTPEMRCEFAAFLE